MLAVIGDVAGLRVLDAGCAAGYYAAAIAARAADVDAIDASPAMIALVEAKRLPNVRARVHDLAEPLSWIGDGSLDLVVSSLTMHYLASWDSTFAEFHRALRNGGRLVVSTHHPAMTAPLVESYFETQPVTDSWTVDGNETQVSFFHRPMDAIVNAFTAAGFAVERMVEPRLENRDGATGDERRLATRPWFLIIEAKKR